MNNINFRDCGDCNLCCKLPAIPNFKNSFEWCKNCNIGVGCSIYKNRPEPCKQFSCLWKAGLLAEDFKPNKVGFFITIDNELATVEKVLTVYAESHKINKLPIFLNNINITDKSGQPYRFVIRYNKDENDLYIYDPKVINKLIHKKEYESKRIHKYTKLH